MTGYTCAWCGEGHLGVDCSLPRPRFCKDETRRLVPRLRKLVRALQGKVMLERLWNEQLWSMIQSLEKQIQDLRQELLERAEAHEEAEARYRAAKDFGQAYEDIQNDLEHAESILERHGI